MLRPATNVKRGGTALAWGGGAVVLIGVLQFLKEELVAFNLDKWPLLVASLAIFLTGLALGEIGSAKARRQADEELEDRLDDALACWPPQRAAALSPYDVGVRPALQSEAGPYIERRVEDKAIAEAFAEADVIVVFGPQGAGKSRSAFHAIPGDAVMLIPENAEGLATLLQRCTSLLIRDESTVLWLDDLDRFADGLDVDRVLKFVQRGSKRSIRRRLSRDEPPPGFVKVVATIRKDALDKLLAGDGDAAAHPAVGRLMSVARGIALPGELSPDDRKRFEAVFKRPPHGKTVADAFASTWEDGWRGRELASLDDETPWSRPQIPVMPILLGCMVAVAVGWLFVKTMRDELTVPPPIDQQVSTLIDDAVCPVEVFPAKGKGLKDDDATSNRNVLVAIEHGGQCGVSDRVRFYRQRDRRLREIATIGPQSPKSLQRFECRGPTGENQNACHVVVQGKDQFIIGAFRDAQTNLEVPVAISFESGELTVAPLPLPKLRKPELPGVPKSIRAEVTRPVDLRLGVADSDQEIAATACKDGAGCSPTRPAQVTAVVPPDGDRPALLLAGYTTDGTTDSPEKMLVKIWKLALDGRRPTLKRDCVVLRDGRVRNIEIPYKADALSAGWQPRNAQVMC